MSADEDTTWGYGISGYIGIEPRETTPARTVATVSPKPELMLGEDGPFFGGTLLAVVDRLANAGCRAAIGEVGSPDAATMPVTVQLNAHFIANTRGAVTIEARPLHVGRTTVVMETSVRDERGRLLLLATSTHLVRRLASPSPTETPTRP